MLDLYIYVTLYLYVCIPNALTRFSKLSLIKKKSMLFAESRNETTYSEILNYAKQTCTKRK